MVALLRGKDKDVRAASAKLEKLEERYVKVVRFNKLLTEDRASFQRFCAELLPESDGMFEEAAAQETPVNLEGLMRQLTPWRSALTAAQDERRAFRQFVEMIFPGDEIAEQLFSGPSLCPKALHILQNRWVELEDLHNQSTVSINAAARE